MWTNDPIPCTALSYIHRACVKQKLRERDRQTDVFFHPTNISLPWQNTSLTCMLLLGFLILLLCWHVALGRVAKKKKKSGKASDKSTSKCRRIRRSLFTTRQKDGHVYFPKMAGQPYATVPTSKVGFHTNDRKSMFLLEGELWIGIRKCGRSLMSKWGDMYSSPPPH